MSNLLHACLSCLLLSQSIHFLDAKANYRPFTEGYIVYLMVCGALGSLYTPNGTTAMHNCLFYSKSSVTSNLLQLYFNAFSYRCII